MYTRGKRTQHEKPGSVVGRGDQPEAGDGQIGRYGVAERPVVTGKPGNAGGGNRASTCQPNNVIFTHSGTYKWLF
jgi:hypothetical protein